MVKKRAKMRTENARPLVSELPVRRSLHEALTEAEIQLDMRSMGPITVGYPVQDVQILQQENENLRAYSNQKILQLLRYIWAILMLLLCITIVCQTLNLLFLAVLVEENSKRA